MEKPGGKKDLSEEVSGGEIKDWKYFWRRVRDDLTNKNLIPVKILFFFKYGTLFVLYPFLTLHMDSLGLNEWEIGVNQATAPVVAILGPPFAGMVADRVGNFKVLLAVLTAANSVVALLLLLVPKAREMVDVPNEMTFDVSCGEGSFVLKSLERFECHLGQEEWRSVEESRVVCGRVCRVNESERGMGRMEEMWNVSRSDRSWFGNDTKYLLPGGKGSFEPFEGSNERLLVCRSVSDVQEVCSWEMDGKYNEGRTESPVGDKELGGETVKFDLLMDIGGNGSLGRSVDQVELKVQGGFVWSGVRHDNAVCKDSGDSLKAEEDAECQGKCFVQVETRDFCTNKVYMKEYDWQLTFGVYTAFRILLGFVSATSFIMFEGAVLAIMKQYGGDYGLQRMSATFAAMVAAPLSGLLLKAYGFRPVIYLYAFLQIISALITLKIDLHFKKPAEKVISNLKEILSQAEILIFFVAMLCTGTAWGYLETFLFLFLKQLGGSPLLMGLTITVGGIAGLPLLVFSRPIIKRLGHVNVLCIGLLFYCFRLFGYSIIQNPWMCLPFEVLEAVTASLAITAASTYAVALSSLQTIASVQGIMGCLYFGIGRGAGSLIGGILIKYYGHRATFQIFGMMALISAVLYSLVNVIYLRRHSIAGKGLDINNLNGKPDSNHNNGSGAKKQGEKLDSGGFVGPLDVNKFTDIPLDEEGQQGQNKV